MLVITCIHVYTLVSKIESRNFCIQIPFSSRLMYVHSYQSLVWNRVVTHRIQEHGFQPIPGDLVPGNGNGPQVLTEETLPQYTLHDVILPLPGYDITLPNNDGT